MLRRGPQVIRSRVLYALLAFSSATEAANRDHAWTMDTVIPVFTCEEELTRLSPTPPLENVEAQLRSALNEWFTVGGADIRLRHAGRYPPKDPRCTGASPPDYGTIVVTSEQASGARPCNDLAAGFWNPDAQGNILDGKIILFEGVHTLEPDGSCNPTPANYVRHAWATNANYPKTDEADYWGTFMHEVGHVLGFFHHTPTSCPGAGVMCPDNKGRHLKEEDISGLRIGGQQGYLWSDVQLQRITSFASTSKWFQPLPGFQKSIIDRPASVWAAGWPGMTAQDEQTVIFINAITRTLNVIISNGGTPSVAKNLGIATNRGVGLTTAQNLQFMAAIAANGQVEIFASPDSIQWTSLANIDFARTLIPPEITWAPISGQLILSWSDASSSTLRFARSEDLGRTWQQVSLKTRLRTDHPFGFECHAERPMGPNPIPNDWCLVMFAESQTAGTPMAHLQVAFDGRQFLNPLVTPVSAVEYDPSGNANPSGKPLDSFGVDFASMPGQVRVVYRDRGFATVSAASTPWLWNGVWNGDLEPVNYTSFTQHTAASTCFIPEFNRFDQWYGFGAAYDH